MGDYIIRRELRKNEIWWHGGGNGINRSRGKHISIEMLCYDVAQSN